MRRLLRFLKTRSRRTKIALTLLALFFGFLLVIYSWLFADLPSIDQLQAGLALPSTRIYDRNGQLLYEILPPEGGRNTAIPLEEIPAYCTHAVIATEDANFYSHPGVDVVGIARALWINLQGGEILAGGSTITQQVARNLLLDPEQRAERSLHRKLQEAILALRLQTAYSKADILALYLNQTYFGNLAYGIEAAARAYFGKASQELSLAECSLLAGVIQAPSAYDPLTNLEAAKERQAVVLGLMVQYGYLTAEESEIAQNDDLQFAATPFPIKAPHFVMVVWQQLQEQYPEQLYHGGLEVITTVDLNWQEQAEAIVQSQLLRLNEPSDPGQVPANAHNAALVALDPFTGQVLTMLGSPNYFDETIDGAVNAALALRQPGSALKPFTYAAAMNPALPEPWTAATMILDVETPFITRKLQSYTPANFGLVEHGPSLVREALASSFNIPAVVTLEHVGIPAFVQLLADAGVSTLAENPNIDLAITLGGGEVRLLDLAQAYSIFANGGYRVDPSLILKVSDHAGNTLYEWTPPTLSRQVLDERVAYIITDILSDNEARIPSFGPNSALNIGRPAAAKTGTTTDYRDNWVVGYTPNLVVGVWVGNANNTTMRDITGVSGAAPIWNAFLRRILLGQPELTFTEPPGLVREEVCALSGLRPTPACTLRRTELFINDTQPTQEDTFYQTFVIDSATGYLADDTTPDERRTEQVFIVLPQEARDWGIRNGLRQPPQQASIAHPDATQGLRLLEPDPYTVFQISPVTPAETQRLRLTVGTPPGTQSVTYWMDGELLGTVTAEPWALWWSLTPGQHELAATAVLADGSQQTSEAIPFSVTVYTGPDSRVGGGN
ncbi:MAG: transglycosylase domain-containing protein [Anaerolineaceae bacterium]|nr:transglycosylase domain-containing protein [Anaerolineaceae bacterium]